MFLENKFTTWYYQLVNTAIQRDPDPSQYYEKHHIIPRCLGGLDNKQNLVKLTAREHYIAHMLLVKMTKANQRIKMQSALWKMLSINGKQNRYIPCNRQYEMIKKVIVKNLSDLNKGRVPWNKGKRGVMSFEARQKISKARTGTHRVCSEVTRQKISASSKRNIAHKTKPQTRPRLLFVIKNRESGEIIKTTNLRSWCKQQGFNSSLIYQEKSVWIIIEKYKLRDLMVLPPCIEQG